MKREATGGKMSSFIVPDWERAVDMSKLKVLDLFSGIGGFSLGLERAGMKTVAFCEIDLFCRKVLRSHWQGVPIFKDVKTLKGEDIEQSVDVICGGFPCQDISKAGKMQGIDGSRSSLYTEMLRLVGELRPSFVIMENSAELLIGGIGRIIGELSEIGYDSEWQTISASSIGAPHQRERTWIIAYPQSSNDREGYAFQIERQIQKFRKSVGNEWLLWRDQSPVFTMDDGLPTFMDEYKAVGNTVVPYIPEIIGRAIIKGDKNGMANT